MKPIDLNLHADGWSPVVYAKNQPEYIALPVLRSLDGRVVSCWGLTWRERLRLLVTGKLWLTQLTFNHALQPVKLETETPRFEAFHAD